MIQKITVLRRIKRALNAILYPCLYLVLSTMIPKSSNAQQELVVPYVALWSDSISFQVESWAILVDSITYVDFPLNYWVELTTDTTTLANFDSTVHVYYDKYDNNFQYYNLSHSGFASKTPNTWYFFRERGADTLGNNYYSHYVAAKTGGVGCDTCQNCEECDSLYRQTYFMEYFSKLDTLVSLSAFTSPPQWTIDSSKIWAKNKADNLPCRLRSIGLSDSTYSLNQFLVSLPQLPYCPTCPISAEYHDLYVRLNAYCDSFPIALPGSIQLLICPALSIEKLDETFAGTITLYPIPASTQLFIETTGVAIEQVNIYNTTGSLVSQTKLLQNKTIDISELAQGVYVAEIVTKEASVKRRWVKM